MRSGKKKVCIKIKLKIRTALEICELHGRVSNPCPQFLRSIMKLTESLFKLKDLRRQPSLMLPFEKWDFSDHMSFLKESLSSDSSVISRESVTDLMRPANIRKRPGPDQICGEHYDSALTNLVVSFIWFFKSPSTQTKSYSMKSFHCTSCKKMNWPKQLKDFRPVALTSLRRKSLRKLIKVWFLNLWKSGLIEMCWSGRKGVEEALLFILDSLYKPWEKPQAHTRLLFRDFSSAFNSMQPHLLIQRLFSELNLPHQETAEGFCEELRLCHWFTTRVCLICPSFDLIHHECNALLSTATVTFSDDMALPSLLSGSESNRESSCWQSCSCCEPWTTKNSPFV